MLLDPLANALNMLKTYDSKGKKEVVVRPTSNLIQNVLATLMKEGYIGEFERIDNAQGGEFRIQLLGRINKIGVVKPRFSVKLHEIDQWEKQYLPAINFGHLIMSTPEGVITQKDAIEKHVGGRLLAYVF